MILAIEGTYFGVGLILLLIVIYLAMVHLKVKEIIAEVEGSRRSVEELFTIKTKKIIQLKAVLEPHATPKIKEMFKKLDRIVDDFIKSTTEEKIIKSEDVNSLLNQIIEEAKNNKNLILDEYFHTVVGELGAINTRLTYAKRAYMEDINQYEKMKKKFPFSIFPWPKWQFGISSQIKRKQEIKGVEEIEEEPEEAKKSKEEPETGIMLSEEEKMALEKIKKKKAIKKTAKKEVKSASKKAKTTKSKKKTTANKNNSKNKKSKTSRKKK